MGLIHIPISRVDQKFLNEMQEYMTHELGNKPNTVRNKLQRFRGLVNEAFKQGLISKDPYYQFERVKREKVSRAKLGEKEINRIVNLELEKGSELWHVRNYFIFSFYMAGIRFSDICTLTPENLVDGRLKYEMKKTGSTKNIKLLEPAIEILKGYNTDKKGYIFPILNEVYKDEFVLRKKISSKNVIVNRHLKELAKQAKIDENISFHVSRHSFANYALQKGMGVYSISKALAHSNLKTTEVYLKSFDEELLDNEMENIFK
ncbi:MAG: tyrosine-type recombinase/integrase [Balneolaceae bacterium]|nr:tyrosine-type recombinase/integrase [Balneolaceae bacterium]MBO6546403.1 tyrosine-type recombinase/integrase [Balneolaceae bacterium]MBO6648762.1 tyrosine-type recombinase/integrase [Balneolaceae bacterium]